MKTHLAKVVQYRNGATRTSTLCGRLSNQCDDGINSTDLPATVTCRVCLRKLLVQQGKPSPTCEEATTRMQPNKRPSMGRNKRSVDDAAL